MHELDGKTNAIRRQNSQYKQNLPQNQTQLRRTPQFPRKSNPISILPAATNNFFKQAKNCYYCGNKHGQLCPAFGQQCSKCEKLNHFAWVCQSSYPSSSFNANQQQIHELEQQWHDSSFTPNHHQPVIPSPNQIDINKLFIVHVSNSNTTAAQNEILTKLNINDQFIEFKVDTGAQCNIILFPILNQIKNKPPIRNSNAILHTYGGNVIPLIGVCTMTVKTKNKAIDTPFHIVDVNNTKPLIGIKSCQDRNIFIINTVESDH